MRRGRSLRRREAVRNSKRKFIIYCEGKNTEPEYLEALKRWLPGALIDLEIIGNAGVPNTIAGLASARIAAMRTESRRSKQSFDKADEVWAVFDEDEHPQVKQALQRCADAGVGIGYSNPCFEVWLVLHCEDFDRACTRHEIQKHLETLRSEYDRKSGKNVDCDDILKDIEKAEVRAENQKKRRADERSPWGVPSTTMYELTRKLRDANTASSASLGKKETGAL